MLPAPGFLFLLFDPVIMLRFLDSIIIVEICNFHYSSPDNIDSNFFEADT